MPNVSVYYEDDVASVWVYSMTNDFPESSFGAETVRIRYATSLEELKVAMGFLELLTSIRFGKSCTNQSRELLEPSTFKNR